MSYCRESMDGLERPLFKIAVAILVEPGILNPRRLNKKAR
jgi:hypothetical protein